MKYILTLLLLATLGVNAQETAAILQQTGHSLMLKGDYDNAVLTLERAKQQDPANIDILRDLTYANYLKRDFAKSIDAGKELIENPKADDQCFQMLGMSYKAIAAYKDCAKMYRTGLRRFPGSGVLYNEYGELFAMDGNELDEAIKQWEKGIEVAPAYSSNYYNAAMYYRGRNNWIRAALYGEIFLNLESFTRRTQDVKNLLLTSWRNLLVPSTLQQVQDDKNTSRFEKAVTGVLAKVNTRGSGSIDDLVKVRTLFNDEWMKANAKAYPFQLFNQQQYFIKQNMFNAYNNWLFSASNTAYETWQTQNAKEAADYAAFQQSRVFRVPEGEYYFGTK